MGLKRNLFADALLQVLGFAIAVSYFGTALLILTEVL